MRALAAAFNGATHTLPVADNPQYLRNTQIPFKSRSSRAQEQMNINELKEKRSKLLSDAQAVLLKDQLDVQDHEACERMLADVEKLEQQIDLVERIAAKDAEERSRTKPPRSNPGENRADKTIEEQRKASFEKYIRFGERELDAEERNLLREQRDLLTTGTGPAYLIPQEFYTTLIEAYKYVGNIVSAVNIKQTNNNGAPMKFAMVNDTANVLTTMTQGVAITETDPSFNGFLVSTDTVATMIRVSIQELQDSYFNLDAWIRDAFAIRYARGLDQYIIQGNSSNIQSLASSAGITVNTAAATGPVYNDFVNAYGSLDAAYVPTSKWAMSQATRAQVMGLKDNYGRPLFIVSPNTGTLDQILDQDIVITPNLPLAYNNVSTTTAVTGVLFGDFKQGYTLRTDGPLSILRLDERFMDQLEVGFIAYARLGGASTNAGNNPVIALSTIAA